MHPPQGIQEINSCANRADFPGLLLTSGLARAEAFYLSGNRDSIEGRGRGGGGKRCSTTIANRFGPRSDCRQD